MHPNWRKNRGYYNNNFDFSMPPPNIVPHQDLNRHHKQSLDSSNSESLLNSRESTYRFEGDAQNHRAGHLVQQCQNAILRHRAERQALQERHDRRGSYSYHSANRTSQSDGSSSSYSHRHSQHRSKSPREYQKSASHSRPHLKTDEDLSSQSGKSAKRVVPTLSSTAVQRMREAEQIAGRWLQGTASTPVPTASDVQLVSTLLMRQRNTSTQSQQDLTGCDSTSSSSNVNEQASTRPSTSASAKASSSQIPVLKEPSSPLPTSKTTMSSQSSLNECDDSLVSSLAPTNRFVQLQPESHLSNLASPLAKKRKINATTPKTVEIKEEKCSPRPAEDTSEEVNHLMRAIQLAKEETQLTHEIQASKETIADISDQLEKAKAHLEMLRAKRQAVRQAKISICSNVMKGNVSDEDAQMECTQSTNNRRPNATSSRSQSRLSSSSLNASNEYPRQAYSRGTPDNSSTSSDNVSSNNATTMVPALGNETVRNIVQRVIRSEEIQEHLNRSSDHLSGVLSDSSADRHNAQAPPKQYPLKKIKMENDTLSNVSSIMDPSEEHSFTQRDLSSAVSDVLSLQRPVQQQAERGSHAEAPQAPASSASNVRIKQECESHQRSCSLGEFTAHWGSPILDLVVDNGFLYTCSQDKTVKQFNLQTHELVKTFSGHQDMVHCIAVTDHPKGIKRLFSGSFDNWMYVFSCMSGRILQRQCFNFPIHCVLLAWDSLFLGLENGEVVQYHLGRNNVVNRFAILKGPSNAADKTQKKKNQPNSFKQSTSGGGNPSDDSQATTSAVSALAHSKEGASRILIVACQDGRMSVRNVENGLLRRVLPGHTGSSIFTVLVSGYRLFSTSAKLFKIHDFTNGTSLMTMQYDENITSMALNDKVLVLAMLDGSVRIHQLDNSFPKNEPSRIIHGNRRKAIVSIKLHEDKIIAGSCNGHVIISDFNESIVCKFGSCTDHFTSRDDLIYHIVCEHINQNKSERDLPCQWPRCSFVFSAEMGIQDIEAHVESHV